MQDIEHAKRIMSQAQRLVFFTGAGVSADSGVPTFRGPGTESFWGKYSPEELCTPEAFHANPQRVYDFYSWRRTQLAQIKPNAAHEVIAEWQRRKNAVILTQNIDGLHEKLAPAEATVLRLHGTLAEDKCESCDWHEAVELASPPPLRKCPRCGGGYLRPAVVFFNEPLDPDVWAEAESAAEAADAFVVVGTSGAVWPAAGLVHHAARRAQVIVVNLEPSGLDDVAAVTLHGRAAEIFPLLR